MPAPLLAEVPPVFLGLLVVSAIALLFSGLWWLQAVMAERGDIANPHHPGGDERLAELDHERKAASASVKVIVVVAAVVLVASGVAALLTR